MALGIPDIKVAYETPAIGPRSVVLGIGLRGAAEEFLSTPTPTKEERIFNRMPGLMAQDAHTPVVSATFHFEHLAGFQLREPRMRRGKTAPQCQVLHQGVNHSSEIQKCGLKSSQTSVQFTIQLLDRLLVKGAFEAQIQIAHAEVE
jgi:hypothetical protein